MSLLQHITITQCCQKDFSLNHTDTRLYKKRDRHNTAPHMFDKTRYMYAVSSEARHNPYPIMHIKFYVLQNNKYYNCGPLNPIIKTYPEQVYPIFVDEHHHDDNINP